MLFRIVKIFIISGLVGYNFVVYAKNVTDTAQPQTINQVMAEVGKVMIQVFPLIVSKREFGEQETRIINQGLEQLIRLFRLAELHINEKSDAYQISYRLVSEHLETSKRVLELGDIDTVRGRLYTLGTICASCHTQDSKMQHLFKGTNRTRFNDDFSYAEFNYITRNYQLALVYYDKGLISDNSKTEYSIILPLQRLITIYVQVYNRPGEGAAALKKYSLLKTHTDTTRRHLAQWITGLIELDKSGASKLKSINFKLLESLVLQYLGSDERHLESINSTPQQEVSLVWLQGVLYRYLNSNPPESQVPQILYWLAKCDRAINYNFYFSIADLYLKDCILNYSSHPYAKHCFEEYRSFVTSSYSGAAGTFVPEELARELQVLEQAIVK